MARCETNDTIQNHVFNYTKFLNNWACRRVLGANAYRVCGIDLTTTMTYWSYEMDVSSAMVVPLVFDLNLKRYLILCVGTGTKHESSTTIQIEKNACAK